LGSVDPHNMLQQSRWRRKKKKKEEKTKSYVKGKVIDGRHELYALSIAVMLGVRTSIAKTNSILTASNGRRMLTPQDFMSEEKYEFAPKGSATTPPHKLSHTFKFKDYAPLAFAYLRRMFGVNEFDFLLSVCGNANFIEFISNAKSGQFFFYSSDGKYMIKTMTNAESKFLRRSKYYAPFWNNVLQNYAQNRSLIKFLFVPIVLPHYFQHCTSNPNTLITKFLGMYRVKLYHLRRNVKFVIMNSVYHTDKYLQTFYDLKGSVLGRAAKPGQDVLKDNDLRAKLPEDAMSLHPDVRARVRVQIISDCEFLRKMKIMDYSLLLGIHHIPPKETQKAGGKASIAKTGFHPSRRESHRRSSFKGDGGSVGHSDGHSVGSMETPLSPGARSSMSAEQKKLDALRKNNMLVKEQGDSNKKLMSEIRESNMTMTNAEMNGLWDDEDDGSYLEGAHPSDEKNSAVHDIHRRQHFEDIEMKKEETVEQIYWPFHRFFDINGHRRMHPKKCFKCGLTPCRCEGAQKFIRGWGIPDFTPPLSNRKDGGFMMETEGLPMPMVWHGPKGDKLYEGKIFYFGIIDILQQYNAQKSLETRYRKLENIGPKGQDPSCVHPDEYARRFVLFYDEYSGPCIPDQALHNPEQTEIEVSANGNVDDASSVGISVSTPVDRQQQESAKPAPPPKFHVTL
jgi:1-phosphatidylinositol-4-phosphate 5-kinase